MATFSDLDPRVLRQGLVTADRSRLKPGMTTPLYAGGTPTAANQVKPSWLHINGINLKPGLVDSQGNLKTSLLQPQQKIENLASANWLGGQSEATTLFDRSGNVNHLQLNKPLRNDDGGSQFLNAQFDWASAVQDVSPVFYPADNTTPFTFGGQFKWNFLNASYTQTMGMWSTSGDMRGWTLGNNAADRKLNFRTSRDGNSGGSIVQINSAADMVDGWNNCLCRFDGSQIHLYLNGVHEPSLAQTGVRRNYTTYPLTIARVWNNPPQNITVRNMSYWDFSLTDEQVDQWAEELP